MTLSFADDDYIRELQDDRGMAVWRARLSNGQGVVMDDGRPGVEPVSAWLRLADHCCQTGAHLTKLWLSFRTNVHQDILPENADGYFFCKSALGQRGSRQTHMFYLVGALTNGVLTVQKWRVPSLTHVANDVRDPHAAPECLIRR